MMKRLATTAVATLATLGTLAATTAGPASAAPSASAAKAGTTSLAQVLEKDGTAFDSNGKDFDVLEAAVRAVLAAKPSSPVALLADGSTRLTAFLPTDQAFAKLVRDLTGTTPASEEATVQAITSATDIDTIETVLLYHVVPGATLTSPKVIKAEGDKVRTAQGAKIRIHLIKGKLTLLDRDMDAKNPVVVPSLLDVNRGNKQVGHGINRVLRPFDL